MGEQKEIRGSHPPAQTLRWETVKGRGKGSRTLSIVRAALWALAYTRPGPIPVLCNKMPSPTGKGHLLHRTGPDRRATLMGHDVFMRGDSEACNKVPRTPPHTKRHHSLRGLATESPRDGGPDCRADGPLKTWLNTPRAGPGLKLSQSTA